MTKDYGAVTDLDTLRSLVEPLVEEDWLVGFDIETGYRGEDRPKKALFPYSAEQFVVGFSFTTDTRWARYVPLRHDEGPNLDPEAVWEVMLPLLTQRRLVCHNAKFEVRCMRNEGVELGIAHDTMLEAYSLGEAQARTSVGLKDLVKAEFSHQMTELESLFPAPPKGRKPIIRFNRLGVEPEVVAYACEDSAWCLALHERQTQRLTGSDQAFIYRLEMAILPVLCDMEDTGVGVDWEQMAQARAEIGEFVTRMEAEVIADLEEATGRSLAGLNLGSPMQLRKILYEELGMETTRKTKGGETPSTDAIALEKLSRSYPVVRRLLATREVWNLARRFDLWLEVSPSKKPPLRGDDGRVHPGYHQALVGTGRFSAGDPPIQQCPRSYGWSLRDGERFEGNFRDLLVAGDGCYLLKYDLSQIELRVMAGLAQERAMLEAFEADEDIHTQTAARMLGVAVQSVDADTRSVGKTLNFAILYGMGEQSLSERLAVSFERATALYEAYFAGFPGVKSWSDEMVRIGYHRGYTLSWCGRKFTITELLSSNRGVVGKGERMLVNAPVQGGAADYMKLSMVKIDRVLRDKGWKDTVRLVMNQHDELVFEVSLSHDPRDVIGVLRPEAEFDPSEQVGVRFPKIVSEWEFGKRWGSMTPIDEGTVFVQGWKGLASEVPEPEIVLPKASEVPVEVGGKGEPRLVVRLQASPEKEAFGRFIAMLRAAPGPREVEVQTPEGSALLKVRTSLGIESASRISMVLPGARTHYAEGTIDFFQIAKGVAL